MKKILSIIILYMFICSANSQTNSKTYVPDDEFEYYLELYGMGDGISYNDSVFTNNINNRTNINVNNRFISDLTL